MTTISRRGVVMSGGALLGLSACGNGIGSKGSNTIDARVDATRNYLTANFPAAAQKLSQASGVLYMPLVTEAGLFFGGAFGRGALRINDVTVDYYSATQASWGLQIGAQQYAHVLMFMTPDAVANFRRAGGWTAGADLEAAVQDGAEAADKIASHAMAFILTVVALVTIGLEVAMPWLMPLLLSAYVNDPGTM